MGKIEEAIKKYEEDPDVTIYYTYDNRPDYAINEETGEMTIFQYGYFGHTEAKLMKDLPEIDDLGNESKRSVFDVLDNHIEIAMNEYNKAKAHNYGGSNDSTLSALYLAKGKLETLLDLREELDDPLYW